MPWFNEQPTNAEEQYWKVFPEGFGMPISLWPHCGSKRTNSLYRLRYMRNDAIYPSASRFYCVYDSGETSPEGNPPGHRNWGWMDVSPLGEDHLYGEAGPDPDGWDASIDIQAMQTLPLFGTPGIRQSYRVTEPGGGWKEFTYEHPRDSVSQWWQPYMSVGNLNPPLNATSDSNNWPFETFEVAWFRNTVPECYSFPNPLGDGFANFNGSDSWIELTNSTPNVAGRWIYTAQLFIRDPVGAWVMCSTTSVNPRTGYNDDFGQWRSAKVATDSSAPLNQWFEFRMEREWAVPTGNHMKVYFDGIEVGSSLQPNYQLSFNALGGNRPNPAANKWADMRMRDLLFRRGSPAAPQVVLDMPLRQNTCDLGPFANHGIPHNVGLPACPP